MQDGWYLRTHNSGKTKIVTEIKNGKDLAEGNMTFSDVMNFGYRYTPVRVLTEMEYKQRYMDGFDAGSEEGERSIQLDRLIKSNKQLIEKLEGIFK